MGGKRQPKAERHPVPHNKPPQNSSAQHSETPDSPPRRLLEVRGQHFSGPLPHPDILARYNEVVPNGADRIMGMAERQAEHRQFLEKTNVVSEKNRAYLGMILAFTLAIFFGGCGTYLIINGHKTDGLAAMFAPLGGLIGTFFYAERARRKERLERSRVRGEKLPED